MDIICGLCGKKAYRSPQWCMTWCATESCRVASVIGGYHGGIPDEWIVIH